MKIPHHIFQLAENIFKRFRGDITSVENDSIEAWGGLSGERRKLLEKLSESKSYSKKEQLYLSFNKYYNWKKIHRVILRRRLYRVAVRVSVAAIALLVIGVGSLFWIEYDVDVDFTVTGHILDPGKSVATLTLADGSKKELAKEDFVMSVGEVVTVNGNNTLSYRIQDTVGQAGEEKYNEISVPRGGEYHLTLSDGSQVWINSETMVKYPVVFKGRERKIYVSGEVYVNAAKDISKPFLVRTDDFTLQVLGTQFNIRTYKDEHTAFATLVEGSVSIKDGSGSYFKLKPAEQLSYDKKQHISRVNSVEVDLYTSWKDGIYIFEKQRLEDVLSTISRWYDLTFFYTNPELKNTTFSGRLRRYDSASILLNLFEQLGGVTFQVNGRTVVVGKM